MESASKWCKVVIFMFMGEYNHTIDEKGRIIVPVKFREKLGTKFVVTRGLDGCLFVYDEQEWSSFENALKTLPITSKESRQFVRFFLAGAAEVETDKQGRINLPQVLIDYAALDKDIVLVGTGAKVEIWSVARWNDAADFDDVDEIAEHMQNLGFGI